MGEPKPHPTVNVDNVAERQRCPACGGYGDMSDPGITRRCTTGECRVLLYRVIGIDG